MQHIKCICKEIKQTKRSYKMSKETKTALEANREVIGKGVTEAYKDMDVVVDFTFSDVAETNLLFETFSITYKGSVVYRNKGLVSANHVAAKTHIAYVKDKLEKVDNGTFGRSRSTMPTELQAQLAAWKASQKAKKVV